MTYNNGHNHIKTRIFEIENKISHHKYELLNNHYIINIFYTQNSENTNVYFENAISNNQLNVARMKITELEKKINELSTERNYLMNGMRPTNDVSFSIVAILGFLVFLYLITNGII